MQCTAAITPPQLATILPLVYVSSFTLRVADYVLFGRLYKRVSKLQQKQAGGFDVCRSTAYSKLIRSHFESVVIQTRPLSFALFLKVL